MTITTVSIPCDVGLPNNTEFTASQLQFKLSGPDYDTVSNDSIPAATVAVPLSSVGVGTATLWPVSRGTRNTHYEVTLTGSFFSDGKTRAETFVLGNIRPSISGGNLADLLAQSSGGIIVGSVIYATLAEAVAAAVAAAASATTQAGIATAQAGIATTQAGIATTQAGIAAFEASQAEIFAAAAAARAKAQAELFTHERKYA